MLVYLTKHCFSQNRERQGRNDPFKHQYISTVSRLLEKVGTLDLDDFLNDIERVLYINVIATTIEEEIDTLHLPDEIKVIIVESNHDIDCPELIEMDNASFELRTIVGNRTLQHFHWDGIIFSRHGGSQFPLWWCDEKRQNLPIQLETLPEELPYNETYVLAYVRREDTLSSEVRNEFLQNLGGQVHVHCEEHDLPLIISSERTNKCKCGRKEYLRCCELFCKTNICKRCLTSWIR